MLKPQKKTQEERPVLTKVVAYLAHPYLDIPRKLSNIELDEQATSRIFFLLKANKSLLTVLDYRHSEEFPIKNEVLAKLIDGSSSFRASYEYGLRLKQELLDVIAEFNTRSMKNMLIKSLDALPLDSDNIDLLVMEKDLVASFNLLRYSGFVRIAWYDEPYKWLFRRINQNGSHLTIHLHTAIAWDGIGFLSGENIWNKYRQKEIDGVMVSFPSPEHHLLITMAHAFFENREIRLGDFAYVIRDIMGNNVDWNYVISLTVNDRWFNSFHGLLRLYDHMYRVTFGNALIQTMSYELLKEGKWNGSQFAEKSIDQFNERTFLPIAVPTIAVAMALAKKVLTDSRTSFSRRIKLILNLLSRIARRRIPIFRRHPVYLVCFVGQDGTGKTEHARYTLKQLRQMSKKIKTKYIWSRGFGYSFQPFLLVIRWLLVGRKAPKSSIDRSIESRYIARKARLLKEEPMKTIWAYIMITDHLLSLVRAKVALYLGYVVICDRWIIDTLIDVRCDLGKRLNRFLEEKIESLAPKPGMTFIMDVETEELLKRRPEMDPNLLECKRSSYLKYQDRKNFYRINTNDDFETNRKKILTAIMKGFFSQFG